MDFELSCISNFIKNNMFDTYHYLAEHYFYKKQAPEKLLSSVKDGATVINQKYAEFLEKIDEELKKPIVLSPPF